MSLLSKEQIEEQLESLPEWELKDKTIEKTYEFDGFIGAMGFLNAVATTAEGAQHHPDMTIRYNKVTMSLSTHSEGGLTAKDFDLASKIEALNI